MSRRSAARQRVWSSTILSPIGATRRGSPPSEKGRRASCNVKGGDSHSTNACRRSFVTRTCPQTGRVRNRTGTRGVIGLKRLACAKGDQTPARRPIGATGPTKARRCETRSRPRLCGERSILRPMARQAAAKDAALNKAAPLIICAGPIAPADPGFILLPFDPLRRQRTFQMDAPSSWQALAIRYGERAWHPPKAPSGQSLWHSAGGPVS
jgi:hypothetical protein